MSLEQIEAKLAEVNAKRDALKVEARELSAQRDAIVAADGAEKMLSTMSDSEKQALAQQLQAQGITSGEGFGKL